MRDSYLIGEFLKRGAIAGFIAGMILGIGYTLPLGIGGLLFVGVLAGCSSGYICSQITIRLVSRSITNFQYRFIMFVIALVVAGGISYVLFAGMMQNRIMRQANLYNYSLPTLQSILITLVLLYSTQKTASWYLAQGDKKKKPQKSPKKQKNHT